MICHKTQTNKQKFLWNFSLLLVVEASWGQEKGLWIETINIPRELCPNNLLGTASVQFFQVSGVYSGTWLICKFCKTSDSPENLGMTFWFQVEYNTAILNRIVNPNINNTMFLRGFIILCWQVQIGHFYFLTSKRGNFDCFSFFGQIFLRKVKFASLLLFFLILAWRLISSLKRRIIPAITEVVSIWHLQYKSIWSISCLL